MPHSNIAILILKLHSHSHVGIHLLLHSLFALILLKIFNNNDFSEFQFSINQVKHKYCNRKPMEYDLAGKRQDVKSGL